MKVRKSWFFFFFNRMTLEKLVEIGWKTYYIYIYAFSRCFYPKRLTVHLGYTMFFFVRFFSGFKEFGVLKKYTCLWPFLTIWPKEISEKDYFNQSEVSHFVNRVGSRKKSIKAPCSSYICHNSLGARNKETWRYKQIESLIIQRGT